MGKRFPQALYSVVWTFVDLYESRGKVPNEFFIRPSSFSQYCTYLSPAKGRRPVCHGCHLDESMDQNRNLKIKQFITNLEAQDHR